MIPGTAGWLRQQLEKVDDDCPVVVVISGEYFNISGKIDMVTREYSYASSPETKYAEICVCIFPEDDKPPTPDLTSDLPKN